jgi:hypothetical protein
MNHNRFQGLLTAEPQPTQTATATAFVLCPVALQTWGLAPCPWEQIYRMAYEKAQAVVRPSIVERLQANLLN